MDFSNIKLLLCDFDGVMTDNRVLVDQDGKEAVVCNRGDGLGIDMLRDKGILVLILSKERNPVVAARAQKLRIEVLHGVDNKLALFKKEVEKRNIPMAQVCFIGNDLPDIDCLKAAGIGVAVADSHPEALKAAKYVTKTAGGKGAVREVAELIVGKDYALKKYITSR
ncbi:MAG: HAD hydrolase family protein [Nanoarchaeota archaeon]